MANKFIYSHPANEVVQVATMEEPDQHIWNRFSQSTRTEDPQAFEICTAYQQHLSALARYPCQGFGKEDDGKEFEKGVHFYLHDTEPPHTTIAVRIPDKGEVGVNFEFEKYPELANEIEWFANHVGVPGSHWNNLLFQINKALQSAPSNSPTVYTDNTGATFLQQGGNNKDIVKVPLASYNHDTEVFKKQEARIKELEDALSLKEEIINKLSKEIDLAQQHLDLIGAPKYSVRDNQLTLWARIEGCTYVEPKDVYVPAPETKGGEG